MMNPNMNMNGKIGFSGGPNPGMANNFSSLPLSPMNLAPGPRPIDQIRIDTSPKPDSGLCQTCFSDFHQHGDNTYGYDLMKINPATGKISGCFMDRIEQKKW